MLIGAVGLAADVNNCSAELCQLTASGTLADLRWPDFHDLHDDAGRLYKFTGYAPLWVRDGAPTPTALKVIAALKDARSEGLDPEDYDGSRWDGRISGLGNRAFPAERFDLALTVSAMRYAADLRFGRANPEGRPSDGLVLDAWVLERLLPSNDPAAVFQELDPPFPAYQRLRKKLGDYRMLAAEDSGEKLPQTKKPVEPGQNYPGIARLTTLLQRLGDLPPEAPASSETGGSGDSQTYQGALVDAVKHYQARHGLDADGRIGSGTVAALNVCLDHRARQLELAMERYRWIPRDSSRPSIVVNIPEFRLRAFDPSGGQPVLDMKVVTGQAQQLQTPVFGADMRYVIFRPYWNVPVTIVRKEVLPAITRDRSYLEKNDYEVTTPAGKVVSSGAVSDQILAGLRSGKLEVRQRPGPKNALGGVKFVLPNENDVYLHDTPARSLFSRTRRDFSHGCIRLEKPVDLAVWVLRDRPEWTRDKIEEAMNGSMPVQVPLSNPIPVSIVYWTAVVAEDGTTYFFNDIYGQDEELDRQITSGGYGPRPRG
ncbi:MAG: L,D-transpeptidase family protein [Bryobacterales bacterium]|nr:L,D-transpeptidase family protein [Bryobacterales bacterium]